MRTGFRQTVYLLLLATAAAAPQSNQGAGFIHVQKSEIRLEPVPGNPGLSFAVLSGDPEKAGIYVIRARFAAGVTTPPHYHDQDRHVTVISGVWAFGTGESGDCADTIPLEEGAYAMHPKGAIHFDGSCNNEGVEVQIIGEGPVSTHWIGRDE